MSASDWCADTSVVVAALSPWHVSHEESRQKVDEHRPLLPGHVLIESYAALTRLPGRLLAPTAVGEALLASFPSNYPVLTGSAHADLVRRLASSDVAGGRIYDALVAATCNHVGARLLTLDRRAIPTYELIGCPYELVA